MRYTDATSDNDWELWETQRERRRPCSDAYADATSDDELSHILSQLQLIRAGWPTPPDKIPPNAQKVGKHKAANGLTYTVYVLKAKPSHWRLYFFVPNVAKRQILFLYAVSKKGNKRDPKDFSRCKQLIDDLFRGRYGAVPLEVPTR